MGPKYILLVLGSITVSDICMPRVLPHAMRFSTHPPLRYCTMSFGPSDGVTMYVYDAHRSEHSICVPVLVMVIFPVPGTRRPPKPVGISLKHV